MDEVFGRQTRAPGDRVDHKFANVQAPAIPRSAFDRSHNYKTIFDAGFLVPIYLDEVLPGDTHTVKMANFVRMATPLYPVMDDMIMETFWFYVPMRLVWDNFLEFMGEEVSGPGTLVTRSIPQVDAPTGGWLEKSLADYMGIPIGVEKDEINSLPFRCYNLIWNEWFRDQNLQNLVTVHKDDGATEADTDYTGYGSSGTDPLLRRGKRHDYFTGCLPWPQKGSAVDIPLGTYAPVVVDATQTYPTFQHLSEGQDAAIATQSGSSVNLAVEGGGFDASERLYWEETGLRTDLSAATAATINQLREAFAVQQLYELDARGGTRYQELVRAHFGGVMIPDYRVQRPEYLGSSKQAINVNPVGLTSRSVSGAPGEMAAFVTSSHVSQGWTKSFTEHGYVIGLCSVRAALTYQEGLNKLWSRETKQEFYWPTLANLGEQAVLNQEIYLQATSADTDVFGYQERWAEYRYKPSLVTGPLRSTATAPIDPWHLAIEFGSLPSLNAAFIEESPPIDRVISVNAELDTGHFVGDWYFEVTSVRPMPVYSTPGLTRL